MHSSPPTRAPRSQLAIEQPLTGGHWNPPEKDIPHPNINKKPKTDARRARNMIKDKSNICQEGDSQSGK